MRGFLLFVIVLLVTSKLHSQGFSTRDFVFASSLTEKKFENYLSKKKFLPSGSRSKNDTIVNIYSLKEKKNKKDTLQIRRTIEAFQTESSLSFTYFTSLKDEYADNLRALKEAG